MTTRYSSRSLVYVLVLVVATPLFLGAARSAKPRTSATLVGDAPAVVPIQPPCGPAADSEILIGELSCRPDPFGSDTLLSFRALGTVRVSTGGTGELISNVLAVPEDPCPAFLASGTEALQGLGCATGSGGNGSLQFVCHDRRDAVLGIMATVSEAVLTASF